MENEEQTSVSNEEENNSADSTLSMPVEEKMIPQSQVNALVGSKKLEAYRKGQQDAQRQFEEQAQLNITAKESKESSSKKVKNLSPQEIEELIVEKSTQLAQEKADKELANLMAQDLVSKLDIAKKKYEADDFDKAIQSLSLPSMPQLVELSYGLDNSGDIMYHLAHNPGQLGSILALASTNPILAKTQLSQLSSSLKKNEVHQKTEAVHPPLSQVKRSTGGTDNGKRSIRDLRSDPAFRC